MLNGTDHSEATLQRFLTPDEAAEYLGLTRRQVEDAARARRVAFHGFGKHRRYLREDLDQWAGSRRVEAR
jgi:excisionase family DNA binding protein